MSIADKVQTAFSAASQKMWVPAEAACREVLAQQPDHPDALHLLALTLKLSGRLLEALPYYKKIVTLYPDAEFIPMVLSNYANALREAKAFNESEKAFLRAIELKPGYFDAYSNLGLVMQEQGRYNDAKQLYLKALAINPDYADGWNNLGGVYQRHGSLQEAMKSYQKALQLKPNFPQAHYNLGNVYADGGLLPEAVDEYRTSLDQDPDYVEAAISWLRQAQNLCRWEEVAMLSDRLRDRVQNKKDGRVFPFAFIGIDTTAKDQFNCAKQWADFRYLPLAKSFPQFDFSSRKLKSGRIKIGYLSSDLHNHATAYLLAEIIELHDRNQFEIYAYSASPDDGKEMRIRLVAAFDQFVDIQHLSFEQAAKRIFEDGIDLLIDVKGYTRDTRAAILAFRPAPVQVSYLGYPGTLGAPLCDYVITDAYVTPPEFFSDYSEKIVYLPDCYQPNDRGRTVAPPVSRDEAGVPANAFVFACFNHTYKITPEVFSIWMRLLREVEGSVLWLLQSNRWAEGNLKRYAETHGVSSERLIFAPELPLAAHLSRVRCADLFLDTLPVNAHTTASDALWVGLPLITMSGATFISRVAGSLLHACGLDDLIASSADEYYEKAKALADNPKRLSEIRRFLDANRLNLPLFDAKKYTDGLEKRYVQIWENFVSGVCDHLID